MENMLQMFGGLMCIRFVMMADAPFSVGGDMAKDLPMLQNMIALSGNPNIVFVSSC